MGLSHRTRVVIGTTDCDALGHMNVARYFALVVETDISEISNRSATFRNRIWREDGAPVFESHWKSVLLDLETRRAAHIPEPFREALARYMTL